MKFRAAILEAINEPLVIAEVENEPLGIGQVLVQILVSGICGAQLAEIRGEKGNTGFIPHMLGHEAAARVVEIGPGVTRVRPNDRVVCHWRKGEGIESQHAPVYRYGEMMFSSGRVTTFSEFSVCSENRVTRVPEETPNDLCALLGCGLSTALGVMENEAELRMGERVLVVGCGGVGLSLIKAARMFGASRVIGTDNRDKMKEVMSVGATAFSFAGLGLTEGLETFDVIVDTSGNGEVMREFIDLLASGGRYILVGQPKAGIYIPNAGKLFEGRGKTIKATQGGNFQPSTDIPRYVAAWKAGAFSLTGIVTHRFPFSQINEGIELVKNGVAGRVMIDMI